VYLGWNNIGNKLAFTLYNGSTGENLMSDDSINFNEWFLFVATWDGTTKRIFINGKDQSTTQTLTGNINAYFNYIGREGGNFFNGLIDEVQIYNVAISESEIEQNYLSGLNNLYAKGLITELEYNERLGSIKK
jgi:hypothetical protein